MVTKSTLDAGEDYATLADILAADDLPHETLTVWGWTKNGAPLKIRVRGLTLPEREDVRARAWKEDGTRDNVALFAGYFRYGFVVPSLNDEQARQMVEKQAGTVEQIADFINTLTEMNYGQVTAIANELARAHDASGQDTKPARARRKAA
jgi:hypothetical protein